MDDWAYRVVEIAEGFASANAGDATRLLRLLHGALRSSPPAVVEALGKPCESGEVENLIIAGSLIELAYLLVGRAGLLVSRFPAGEAQATVVAPALFQEQDHRNLSVPLAIGGALVAGLVAWSAASRTQGDAREAFN